MSMSDAELISLLREGKAVDGISEARLAELAGVARRVLEVMLFALAWGGGGDAQEAVVRQTLEHHDLPSDQAHVDALRAAYALLANREDYPQLSPLPLAQRRGGGATARKKRTPPRM